MKILHLISGGDTYGAKTHVINLLKELQKTIDVELICFMEGDFSKEAEREGINIKILEQKNRMDLSVIKELARKINKENYDLVHSHGARANFISLVLKMFTSVNVITTIHSDYRLDDFLGSPINNLIFRRVNAFSLRFLNYYIGVSQNFKDMMIRRGFPKERVFSVYNGINFDEPISCIDRRDFFNSHSIVCNGDEIWVGIMGRLHPVKGHRVFLEGAAKAYAQNKKLRFLIAGEGEERKNLTSYAEKLGIDKVCYFLGYIDRPFDFFNAVDINTLTSYSESFPYVILEGARLKKATISSQVGGIEDLIFDGETGYLFDIGDSEKLASNMLKLADDGEERRRLGENLYGFVKDNYSTKNMADKHIEIYNKIVNKDG